MNTIAEAQKRSLPSRVMSPALITDTIRNSVPSFPNDTTLTFPLGKDYLLLMYQLSNVRVYTYRERLGYVLPVPLLHKRTFTILRTIPIPVPVDQEHFFYIDVRNSVLCLDQTMQYYFTMTDDALSRCKWAEPGRYACTHQRTLLSTVATESCAVTLLHRRDSISSMRDTGLTFRHRASSI